MYYDHAADRYLGQWLYSGRISLVYSLLDMSTDDPSAILARYVPLYKYRYPRYQVTLLSQLRFHWAGHRRLLDVGGGSGVIAEAVHIMLGADVTSVDVVSRFAKGLTIKTQTYDGVHLPFPDQSFDAVTFINVLHHVPAEARLALLKECSRVCSGPIYIKDHACRSRLDLIRLRALDTLGNTPFGGMVKAQYLLESEWESLRSQAEYIESSKELGGGYRTGFFARAFPDRLESFRIWIKS